MAVTKCYRIVFTDGSTATVLTTSKKRALWLATDFDKPVGVTPLWAEIYQPTGRY